MKIKYIYSSNRITISILLIGTIFFISGILREEYTIVMDKAINICLECVGIG